MSSTLSVTSFIRSEAGVSAPNISSSSDRSLKKNIKELGSATHQINKLRPVYFDWKDDVNIQSKSKQIGFIAQEVKDVYPELVMGRDEVNPYYSVEYSKMVAILTKGFQEQDERICKMESQNMELRLQNVEKSINKLAGAIKHLLSNEQDHSVKSSKKQKYQCKKINNTFIIIFFYINFFSLFAIMIRKYWFG